MCLACWLVQGLTADEEADNTYCEQLYQDYVNDPDPDKHQTISLEELCKREGVYKRYRGGIEAAFWSLFGLCFYVWSLQIRRRQRILKR